MLTVVGAAAAPQVPVKAEASVVVLSNVPLEL